MTIKKKIKKSDVQPNIAKYRAAVQSYSIREYFS